MTKLKLADLLSLEQYAIERDAFRAQVMEHKKKRRLQIGAYATWLFEDRLMVQYQIQEMLRAGQISEEQDIAEEIAAYNPLIPDGTNWKATFVLEYPNEHEHRRAIAQLTDIEDHCWVQVMGHERVYAIADEDQERESEEKVSTVHFLRFELDAPMRAALKKGVEVGAGIDHRNYLHSIRPIPAEIRSSLIADLK